MANRITTALAVLFGKTDAILTPAPGRYVVATAEAVEAFAGDFALNATITGLAPHMSCGEIEVFADLLSALGETELAGEWLDAHAATDEEDDAHHRVPHLPGN